MTETAPAIGRPIERVEDPRLLRGRGRYVDDLSRDRQLYAVVLRSSMAHGTIRKIDVSAAAAMPGVHVVLTAADIGKPLPRVPGRLFPLPEHEPFYQPVIASSKVRYVGEPLALVIAESPALGEDALELIEVDIEPLPAVSDRATSLEGASLLFEAHGSNCAIHYRTSKGDAAKAFVMADRVVRQQFRVHRHTGITMEPRGVLAEWDAARGRMTVWGAAKVPFANRRILAAAMGLAEDAVEMVEGDNGGSFGVRGEFFPEDFLVPFAARLLGRPVKWTEDRREHFLAVSHSRDVSADVELACRSDGEVLAIRGRAWVDIGAYLRSGGVITSRNVGQFLAGPYRIENVDVDVAVQLSNKSPSGTYRGPGRYEADFIRERLFDLAAGELGIDRVTFRRRNLVPEDEMPYPVPNIAPAPNPTQLDSGAYALVLDRCLAEARWEEKQSLQGKLIDGRYHGLALGCFIEGGAAGPKENARIVVEADGALSVYVGSSAVGQGVETVLGQIAADAMDVSFDRVRVLHGSTSYVQEGWGSYASRSTVMGGSAILAAAAALKDRIREAAAKRFNCAPEEVTIARGRVTAPDARALTLADLAPQGLADESSFLNHRHTYTYGTHIAHVAVDARLGHVQLVNYVAVEDVGRIINPLTLHGQVVGAIVQGLGGTLLEDLVYDREGQLLTATFADYLMPLATDFPQITAISLELRPSPFNPLGAKGAGEGGIIPVGGVIANAVAAALRSFNVEPNELPLSPPMVWRLLANARRAGKVFPPHASRGEVPA
jgi:carbon-monoxide dehydrogenase large subunit